MNWLYLVLAGFGEVGFVMFMKLSNGFKNRLFTVLTLLSASLSLYFLSLALRTIPLGVGYAIWTGIGAAGSVILGMIFFKEPRGFLRIVFLLLIIISVAGLKLAAPE
ncbi:DMT family transporter [Peribacillus kribbensis]|uniref:DMT family transporter n=1 Tax=Peribacillus kribbensis TaxID=356658 RepID=UPI0003FDEA29|nr:multidrug efflux SMR transporter [Peribacillus kribbensis]